MPLTWPVGVAGDFHGVLDRATGEFVQFTRTAGGATERATRSDADARPLPRVDAWTDGAWRSPTC